MQRRQWREADGGDGEEDFHARVPTRRSISKIKRHDAHALKVVAGRRALRVPRNFGHEIDERDLAIDLVVGA